MNRTEFYTEVKRFVADKSSRTEELREELEDYYLFEMGGSDFDEYINKKIRKKLS